VRRIPFESNEAFMSSEMSTEVETMFKDRAADIALIVVGNEVLSGDTADTNGNYLAKRLSEIGHRLRLIITIPDTFDAFDEYVKPLIDRFDLIFTSGGIGSTPDDITREAVAGIFGRKLILSDEALKKLEDFYGDRLNDNAKIMALIPEGATLVSNSRTGAPGFKLENVYCFAGVPQIFQDMFEVVAPVLGGKPLHKLVFKTIIGESRFADIMREACTQFPDVEIGSYPRLSEEFRARLVFKGYEIKKVEDCCEFMRKRISELERTI
jgi:molybdenum cofactor synthesis domain-containing protein